MVIVATFIICLVVFLIIIDIFAIMFRLTGMSIEKARFQVISLLTSTGYTTKESESIAQHPTRRRLASALMIISYVSTLTFISLLVNMLSNSLLNTKSIIVIVVFIVLAVIFIKSSLLERIESIIEHLVERSSLWRKTNSRYLSFITKHKGYSIGEVYLSENSDLIGKSIKDSGLNYIEIKVLNVDQGHEFINFPSANYIFQENDKLTVYGNTNNIKHKFH
ncbi:TrkA C-terminal domain-containing protein [Romboutsia sp.]|uniref:TrkA C-terminal domain-containing protein n=1 Tax=Romboutsia sp. TaxID=1965302 RepID=UPI003F3F214A